MFKPSSLCLALATTFAAPHAVAAPTPTPYELDALLAMDLEQLGKVQVTATSRSASSLVDTPASVLVIHREDIRVPGIRSLPEALRLAANLHVAQINASGYAVSARGMKTSLSNKLLVMVDGRPIYTPSFAGVPWDMQAVPMEDIDRIEVVSGPGAAAWGANAVNGVINILTRSAGQTSGGYAKAWTAEEGNGVSIGQSFAAGDHGGIRLYAQRERNEESASAQGQSIADGWNQRQGDFRGDWRVGDDDFQLQGDVMRAESSLRRFGPVEVSGHNLVGRWTRKTSADSQWSLNAYYDVVDRLGPEVIGDRMSIAAVEFARDSLQGAHHLTWGAGCRHARDESHAGAGARLVPANRTLKWGHALVQDEIAISGRLTINLGLRMDRNSYTGVEVLPTARFSHRQQEDGLLWGALPRAVRTPARFDREFFFPASEPFIIRGGPQFDSEVSNVAELGYRAQPSDWLSFSLTGFHHWHDNLRGGEPAPGGGVIFSNRVESRSYGAEGWATLRMPGQWQMSAGFIELRHGLRLQPGFQHLDAVRDQGNDPEHQLLLCATRRIGQRQQLSAFVRHLSELPAPVVSSYVQLDARWSFTPTDQIEIGLDVRKLLDERHAELQPTGGLQQSEFGRSAHLDPRLGW